MAHGVVLAEGHAIETEISEGAEKAGAGRRLQPVSAAPKFGEQVEDASRLGPAKREMTANLGACVVRYEQTVGAGIVWCGGTKLVMPQPKLAPTPQLPSN